MSDTFRLFPDNEEAFAGDVLIQWLIDQQEAGNERAKAVGSALSRAMEEVFPNFGGALENITSGADERKQQLNETFGLRLGEPTTPDEVSQMALGFGVGSIKSISGVTKGLKSLKLGGKEIVKKPLQGNEPPGPKESLEDLSQFSKDLLKKSKESIIARRADAIEASTGQQNRPQVNAPPGTRPPLAFLEAQAVANDAAKRIQTRVKKVQKSLDELAVRDASVPDSLIQQIAKKGLRAKATHEPTENTIVISFKSEKAVINVNDEFAILPTPDGPVLAVNFNSPTIKETLRPRFREAFPNKFLVDEIGAEFQPGELQRMSGETAKDAPPPDNFSYYSIENFEDGLQVINRMLGIANAK